MPSPTPQVPPGVPILRNATTTHFSRTILTPADSLATPAGRLPQPLAGTPAPSPRPPLPNHSQASQSLRGSSGAERTLVTWPPRAPVPPLVPSTHCVPVRPAQALQPASAQGHTFLPLPAPDPNITSSGMPFPSMSHPKNPRLHPPGCPSPHPPPYSSTNQPESLSPPPRGSRPEQGKDHTCLPSPRLQRPAPCSTQSKPVINTRETTNSAGASKAEKAAICGMGSHLLAALI